MQEKVQGKINNEVPTVSYFLRCELQPSVSNRSYSIVLMAFHHKMKSSFLGKISGLDARNAQMISSNKRKR